MASLHRDSWPYPYYKRKKWARLRIGSSWTVRFFKLDQKTEFLERNSGARSSITYAMAVFPVPGCPPIRMALPAILPSLIILRITPAARLASVYMWWASKHSEFALNRVRERIPTFQFIDFSCTYLANHTLGDLSRVKRVVETKTSDMWMSSDTLNSRHVFDFLHFGVNSRCGHVCSFRLCLS